MLALYTLYITYKLSFIFYFQLGYPLFSKLIALIKDINKSADLCVAFEN
jgi:hypothetical protein